METTQGRAFRGGLVTVAVALALVAIGAAARADEVELKDGRKFTGLVQSQDSQEVKFRVVYPNGGTMDRTFAAGDVKAVKKMPLPPAVKEATTRPAGPATAPKARTVTQKPPKTDAAEADEDEEDPDAPDAHAGEEKIDVPVATTQPEPAGGRTTAEIDALITKAGKEPPAWWDSVKLTFPDTLDLAWPERPGGPWNPQKNISQYLISVINPNPARHKDGIKLLHHLMTVNKGDASVQGRTMSQLGRLYGIGLQDYARGAYWYRRLAKLDDLTALEAANLAYCYWKLGSRSLALAELGRTGQYCAQTVRVLGQMGDVTKALDLAKRLAGSYAEDGLLAAGDVCFFNGKYKEAIQFYQQVLAVKPKDPAKPGRLKRYHERANASMQAAKVTDQIDVRRIPDGTYRSESVGYRGPVTVEVVVKAGALQSVKVVQTKEDWPFNAQVVVPAQILEKQSVKGIDTVSGATVTAEAVINATAKALGGAGAK